MALPGHIMGGLTEAAHRELAQLAPGEVDSALSDRLKEQGNEAYKNKQYDEAADLYTQAVFANPLNAAAYANRAAAYLKLDLAPYAFMDCIRTLKFADDDSNLCHKALLRAATACVALDRPALGRHYLAQLGSAFPQDARAVAESLNKLETNRKKKTTPAIIVGSGTTVPVGEPHMFLRTKYTPRDHPGGPRHVDRVLLILNKIHDTLPESFPIEPRYVPGKGIGLFATRDIASGEEILAEKAKFCAVVDSSRCHHCLARHVPVACMNPKCSQRFCSDRCRDEAVSLYHRALCGRNISELELAVSEGITSAARSHLLAMKLFGAAMQERDAHRKRFFLNRPADMDIFNFLTRKEDNLTQQGLRTSFDFYFTLHEFLMKTFADDVFFQLDPRADFQSINGILSMCTQNGFGTRTGSLCTWLLQMGSFFNHSCEPNVSYADDIDRLGAQISFRAHKNIQKGTELTISYVPTNEPVQQRRFHLFGVYGFECDCRRCLKESKGKLARLGRS